MPTIDGVLLEREERWRRDLVSHPAADRPTFPWWTLQVLVMPGEEVTAVSLE